jgi:outer membrane usher protein
VHALRGKRGRRLFATLAAVPAISLLPGVAEALQLDRHLGGKPRPTTGAEAPVLSAGQPLYLRSAGSLARFPPRPPRRPYPGPTETVIVTLSVNAVAKGERYVRLTPDGKFLARVADVREAAYLPQDMELFEIDGEEFIALDGLPGSNVSFDEKTLALSVKLAPEGFPPQVYDLRTTRITSEIVDAPRSAMINYRVAQAGQTGGGPGALTAALDAAVTFGGWLLRSQSFHSRFRGEWTNSRVETQAIRDDRENLRRLIVGDAFTPGQVLGSAVPFAGITFMKAYQLAPGMIRHPAAGYRGFADYPSQVDFYVGNTLVTRQQVAPGPYDIRNFNYFGGRRDVRVVVRDMFGREQTIAYPFYFTDLGLAEGLHDYSYQAGWIRDAANAQSESYGRFMASAFHHYGFTDWLTLGFRAEASSDFANAGPSAFYRSESTGQWAAHLGGSYDRETGRRGAAVSLAHSYQFQNLSTQLIWNRYSDAYRVLQGEGANALPRQDFTASVGYAGSGLGSVSAAFTRLALRDREPERSITLSYALPVLNRFNLTAIARRNLDVDKGHEFFIGLQYLPTRETTVNLTGSRDTSGARTYSLNASNRIPPGEGIAYAVTADRRETPAGNTSHSLQPRLAWYARHGTVGAELLRLEGDGVDSSTAYTVSLQGAVVATGGQVLFTRPINDSFALVQLSPPLAGVRIYENSQEIGRTDGSGRILLPNVTAYANNVAAIQDKDVPMEFSIGQVSRSFSPPSRSGTFVEFKLSRVRALTGRLLMRAGAEPRPLAYHLLTIAAGDQTLEAPTGKDGQFYVENIPAGRHRASVQVDGKRCDFDVLVPDNDALEVDVGTVQVCDGP